MKVPDAKFKKNFPNYAALTNGKSPTIWSIQYNSSGRTNGNILLKRTKRSFDAIAEMFHKIVWKKLVTPPQMTLQNIVRKDKYDNVSANVLRPQWFFDVLLI